MWLAAQLFGLVVGAWALTWLCPVQAVALQQAREGGGKRPSERRAELDQRDGCVRCFYGHATCEVSR